jgi:hypothetical protein
MVMAILVTSSFAVAEDNDPEAKAGKAEAKVDDMVCIAKAGKAEAKC